jgi:hypothetical protein
MHGLPWCHLSCSPPPGGPHHALLEGLMLLLEPRQRLRHPAGGGMGAGGGAGQVALLKWAPGDHQALTAYCWYR